MVMNGYSLFPDLQNRSLAIKCSLVSYLRISILGALRESYLPQRMINSSEKHGCYDNNYV